MSSGWLEEGVPAWHRPHKCWVLVEKIYRLEDGGNGNCVVRYVDGGRGTCNNWQLLPTKPDVE